MTTQATYDLIVLHCQRLLVGTPVDRQVAMVILTIIAIRGNPAQVKEWALKAFATAVTNLRKEARCDPSA